MQVVISGIGTAVPPYECQQHEAGEAAAHYSAATPEQAHMLSILYRMSGVERRGSVLFCRESGPLTERVEMLEARTDAAPFGPSTEERLDRFALESGPMALEASRKALERSATQPSEITHLITVTCSGFTAPGFDFTLIHELPLRSSVARTQIGFMGCHAAMNALRVARAFVKADPTAVVLICCVELCSLHYQYGWDPQQIVANSLFADGAAACVVRAEQKQSDGSSTGSLTQLLGNGSTVLPDSADAMSWRVGNNGFRMTLSPKVPILLSRYLKDWMVQWLDSYGLSPEQIKTWAVHPGGPKILSAFAESMSLPPEALNVSRSIMQRHGNMSSPTILFVLDQLRQQQAKGPCVAIGFGPGLVAEAAVLQ